MVKLQRKRSSHVEPARSRTLNGTAKVEVEAYAEFKHFGVAGLIAQPSHYQVLGCCWNNFVQNVLHIKK